MTDQLQRKDTMAIVLERKFLATNPPIAGTKKTYIRSGFLSSNPENVVRVRIYDDGRCTLTVQSEIDGISKQEYGYEISSDDAMQMLENLCEKEYIEKIRHYVPYEGDEDLMWEVDVFQAENKGLVLADINPKSVDQEIILPEWITGEVSDQAQYRNSNLVNHPYSQWVLEGEEDKINCKLCNDLGYVQNDGVKTLCTCDAK